MGFKTSINDNYEFRYASSRSTIFHWKFPNCYHRQRHFLLTHAPPRKTKVFWLRHLNQRFYLPLKSNHSVLVFQRWRHWTISRLSLHHKWQILFHPKRRLRHEVWPHHHTWHHVTPHYRFLDSWYKFLLKLLYNIRLRKLKSRIYS